MDNMHNYLHGKNVEVKEMFFDLSNHVKKLEV